MCVEARLSWSLFEAGTDLPSPRPFQVSTFEVGNSMMEFSPLQEANVYGVKIPGL